nr:tRNA (N6-threonylcarbamoyladenosine(37)-N6)-methyltransferase TrmO [Eubacterium sp.]
AFIHNDFETKFAVPRQSGIAPVESEIIFEKEYCDINAVRGLEEFSHIWLIWGFSENIREKHSLTVRPPRLGGNVRLGVFSTRSPFRPNNLGLSCVELSGCKMKNGKLTLTVRGADLMNGTPIYDIKPYIKYSDCKENAVSGFVEKEEFGILEVEIPEKLLNTVPKEKREALRIILENDPRPAYQNDSDREYGFTYAGLEIKFKVIEKRLEVLDIYAD